jgi:hypothetical protein
MATEVNEFCPLCGEYAPTEANIEYAKMLDIVRRICAMKEPSVSSILNQYGYHFESGILKELEGLTVFQE